MNIGIVTTWFERGAAYVSRQYRDLLARDNEVFIYARGGESYAAGNPRWDEPRVTWARKCFIPLPTAVNLSDFEKWIRANRIEIVFFNEQFWWEPVLLCRRLGITTGAYIDYYTEETVPYFGCYDFLVCNTRRHASVFAWHPQCRYVPWGTDTRLFALRSPGPVIPGVVTFFHSAGMSPYRKGCDLAIEAFSRIQGPARLVIHAQQHVTRSFPRLEGVIRELTAAGRLQCIEETVASPGLFHMGDVYVYPTRLEGIGLTVLEAGSCGLPVIVTACGPMTEFIEHGVNGRHVAVDRYVARSDGYYWPQAFADIDDLVAQMQWYVKRVDELGALKQSARRYAELNFDWMENAGAVADLFRSARKRSLAETEDIARATSDFERKRYLRHKLTPYLLVRAWIEDRHPRMFQVASGIVSGLRNSLARNHG